MKMLKLLWIFAYLGSVSDSSGGCSQEIKRRLRFGRAAMEELGKISKGKDVPLETKAKTIHALAFPIPVDSWGSWPGKKADAGGKIEIWCWRRALQRDEQVGPRAN